MIDTSTLHDVDVWKIMKPEHLWVYNKLQIARMQGLVCGPAGICVPKQGMYIVRPVYNLSGMSTGSSFKHLNTNPNAVEPGMFWCEILKGQQTSTTYYHGLSVSTYQAYRDEGSELYKFTKWKKLNKNNEFPRFLLSLVNEYSTINVEFIGNKVIEVHLRGSPDPDYDELIPVWESDPIDLSKRGYRFVEDYEDGDGYLNDPRLGFWVK